MKSIYEKTSVYSFAGGAVLLFASLAHWLLFWENFEESGEIMVTMLLTGVLSIGSGFFFKRASSAFLEEANVDRKTGFSIDELIFEQLPSFIPYTALMSNTGQLLYKIAPAGNQPLRKRLAAVKISSKGFFVPITYEVLTSTGTRVASFTYKNKWKHMLILLHGQNGEAIGHLELPLLKDLLKNKANLYDSKGKLWRVLEAKNMTGDMDVKDEENKVAASFRFGIFPYAMHPAFQAMAHHDYVKLGRQISNDEKIAYIAVFSYWLRQ